MHACVVGLCPWPLSIECLPHWSRVPATVPLPSTGNLFHLILHCLYSACVVVSHVVHAYSPAAPAAFLSALYPLPQNFISRLFHLFNFLDLLFACTWFGDLRCVGIIRLIMCRPQRHCPAVHSFTAAQAPARWRLLSSLGSTKAFEQFYGREWCRCVVLTRPLCVSVVFTAVRLSVRVLPQR